ncbi:72 kDa type IV collagenase, partial [Octopus bimaculoides]
VFQRKFNLTVTGTFTQETRNIMKAARCGFPDVIPQEYSVYHKKWAKKALTYTIESYTTQISQDQQRSEFKRAFDEWARHTQLSFTEVSGTADLKINFYKKAHGDGSDFDDKNGVLAHAFYPTDGRIHFDDDEEWGVNASSKKDLYGVMLHEIGHSLGIKHSDISNAVMFPMYSGYIKDLRLHADDVAAIQESY